MLLGARRRLLFSINRESITYDTMKAGFIAFNFYNFIFIIYFSFVFTEREDDGQTRKERTKIIDK